MNETIDNNINTTNVSDNAHQILLIDDTNVKSNKVFNDGDLEKTNQKSKMYLNGHLIMILAVIFGILFLMVIALSIFSVLHCYFIPNHFKKLSSPYHTKTIDQLISNMTNRYISPEDRKNKTTPVNLEEQDVVGTGRAKYVDKIVHYDYEN